MPSFLYSLLVFVGYTLAIILLTGPSISWNETRRSFYVGSNRTGFLGSLATFCASWMSTVSLVAYPLWLYKEGTIAFMGSINAWMFALCLMPFMVRRLRAVRALSPSEWLATAYSDWRLRPLAGAVVLLTSLFILVVQFQGVTAIVGHILGIQSGYVAFSLISLFVLYTTLGGYVSVMRSGVLNLFFVLLGVTTAAIYMMQKFSFSNELYNAFRYGSPPLFQGEFSYATTFQPFVMLFAWGIASAVQPQYVVRVIAARKTRDAYSMISAAAFVMGWIFLSLTLIGLGCKLLSPHFLSSADLDYPLLLSLSLPFSAATLFLIAILAAAVSAANSQLLQAATAFCYDLWPFLTRTTEKKRPLDPIREGNFLFANRLAVAFILLIAMLLGRLEIPTIFQIAHYSWSMIAICFTFPLLLPSAVPQKGLFECLVASLLFHIALMSVIRIPAELSLFVTLALEWVLLFGFKKGLLRLRGAVR